MQRREGLLCAQKQMWNKLTVKMSNVYQVLKERPSGLPTETILLMWLCPRTTKPIGVRVPHLVIKNKKWEFTAAASLFPGLMTNFTWLCFGLTSKTIWLCLWTGFPIFKLGNQNGGISLQQNKSQVVFASQCYDCWWNTWWLKDWQGGKAAGWGQSPGIFCVIFYCNTQKQMCIITNWCCF